MTTAPSPELFRETFQDARKAIGAAVVGHEQVVEEVLLCLFAGGHCLLEGVPGIGKTLLARSVAAATGLDFGRIQFTPDLMPADVVGTDVLTEDEHGGFDVTFRRGPIFGSLVLADEINRATPKTQSALLQAMEERQVTVARRTHDLPRPFMVLATQNPVEMEGTYPLPEAQLDRFQMKVVVGRPNLSDLTRIVNLAGGRALPRVPAVCERDDVLALCGLTRDVVVAPHLQELLGRIVLATHPDGDDAPALVRRVVRYGASPRAAVSLATAAKARALSRGRPHVSEEDVRVLARPVLRHRVHLNFEGEADAVDRDELLGTVLDAVQV